MKIKEGCYYYKASVNIGYVTDYKGTGIIIDTGLEPQAIKKVIKAIENEGLPITHCLISHAHADHFGGAEYLKREKNITIYAPFLEAAIMENPFLEPLYLFHGTNPPKELRNKFVEGTPVKIDQILSEGRIEIGHVTITCISLPGHSYNQFGFIINHILYAADAYFGQESLGKHIIPYIVDVSETLNSLHKILSLHLEGALPGHGIFETNYKSTIKNNIETHVKIINKITQILEEEKEGLSLELFIQGVCHSFGITLKNLGSWALYRTAISAYVNKLIQEGKAVYCVEENVLYIKMAYTK